MFFTDEENRISLVECMIKSTKAYESTAKNLFNFEISLIHLLQMQPFSTPWKIRKSYGFLMFTGGREREHWERMGYISKIITKWRRIAKASEGYIRSIRQQETRSKILSSINAERFEHWLSYQHFYHNYQYHHYHYHHYHYCHHRYYNLENVIWNIISVLHWELHLKYSANELVFTLILKKPLVNPKSSWNRSS